jgi:hypothetical protein
LYFNPTLTNAYNGNATLERERLADLKMEIAHQNLQVTWRSSVSGFNSSQSPSRDRRFKGLRKIFSKYKPGRSEPSLEGRPSLEVIYGSYEKAYRTLVYQKLKPRTGHWGAWPKWCEFLDEHQPTLTDKSLVFFLTSTGMVGCASHTVEVGDLVCAIGGGQGRLAFVSEEKLKSKQGARITGRGRNSRVMPQRNGSPMRNAQLSYLAI